MVYHQEIVDTTRTNHKIIRPETLKRLKDSSHPDIANAQEKKENSFNKPRSHLVEEEQNPSVRHQKHIAGMDPVQIAGDSYYGEGILQL